MSANTIGDRASVRIEVWADFACPACYLAKPRLDAAIAATGRAEQIRVRYHAWELFPEATEEPFDSFEHVVHKFAGDEVQARQLEQRMSDLAHAQGQPYLVHHPIANALNAHRVLKLTAEYGQEQAFIDRLQSDLFGSGTDVYHADYLVAAAGDLSIPAGRVEALLAGEEYADEVRADQARARRLGLTGIPFTVLAGRRAIVGVVSTDDFCRAIHATFTEESHNR